jgi:hypothetical protein
MKTAADLLRSLRKKNPYLASEDIMDRDSVEYTISGIDEGEGEFEDGRREVAWLEFEETNKKLVLNKTNAKTLQRKLGDDLSRWIGEKIKLFVVPVTAFGREFGIRVK